MGRAKSKVHTWHTRAIGSTTSRVRGFDVQVSWLWLGGSCLEPSLPMELLKPWAGLGHADHPVTGPPALPHRSTLVAVARSCYTWLCPPLVASASQHGPGQRGKSQPRSPSTRAAVGRALCTKRIPKGTALLLLPAQCHPPSAGQGAPGGTHCTIKASRLLPVPQTSPEMDQEGLEKKQDDVTDTSQKCPSLQRSLASLKVFFLGGLG